MSAPHRVLSLFAGIGGFDLGLERATRPDGTPGFRTVAFCEIAPFPRRALAKHWPEVPCYDDVRILTAERLAADGIAVDAICGGFPCQDVSVAGRGAGLDGARSGLWVEFARLVREIRPAWVAVENSPALRTRGGDRVCADLEAAGYAVWPLVVGAAHAGAPHRRGRVFVLAHAARDECQGCAPTRRRACAEVLPADADRVRELQPRGCEREQRRWFGDGGSLLAVPDRVGCDRRAETAGPETRSGAWIEGSGTLPPDADLEGLPAPGNADGGSGARRDRGGHRAAESRVGRVVAGLPARLDGYLTHWSAEPPIPRMLRGVPGRVQRLATLGNAVVPQVAEAIGRAILAAEARR